MRLATIFLMILSLSLQTAMAHIHDPRALSADPAKADKPIAPLRRIAAVFRPGPALDIRFQPLGSTPLIQRGCTA